MARNYILRKGVSSLNDLIDGGAAFGYPGEYPGRIYYVNNITGSANNDGLSWKKPFAELSTAVTAGAAYQAAQASGNTFIRNIIYIQGTSTMYTYLTALPNHTDVIGIGADPRGDGSGIVVVGSNGAFDGATGTMRGTRWFNIQFVSGNGATSAFHATIAFRSVIENCTFGTTSSAAAAPLSGLDIDAGSGLVIRNCAIVANASFPVTGFAFGGGTPNNFSQCLVENNMIYGSTAGVTNSGYLCDATLFRNNTIYGGSYGIQDTSSESTLAGNAFYVGNFCSGTDAMALTNNAIARSIGNMVVNGTTATVEAATIAEGQTTS